MKNLLTLNRLMPCNATKLLGMLTAALTLGACSTTGSVTSTIAEADGQMLLADAHINEQYESVMTKASEQYQVEPHCESRRIALSKQRKAFIYEGCVFNPENAEFAGAPLSEVVYHFIEGALVRVDVRAEGGTELLDVIKTDMQGFFTQRGSEATLIKQGSYEWTDGEKVAGVREGTGAVTGNIYVRLLDKTLIAQAPWLSDQ